MNKLLSSSLLLIFSFAANAQPSATARNQQAFTIEKTVPVTSIKNQEETGTCWSFGTTSLVESQCLKNNIGSLDISEMFTVWNIYIEKAKNYIHRQGHAQFGEGGLGHDLIRSIAMYGAVPTTIYSGLTNGEKTYDHSKLVAALQQYLDSLLKSRPIPNNWLEGYKKILDSTLGEPPIEFTYNNKKYTPISFAKEVLKFNAADYVDITSFTDHPYYEPFILQVPDNFSNGYYYNLPLNEMLRCTKDAVENGYSVMWDTDVSNNGFLQNKGLALLLSDSTDADNTSIDAETPEQNWDATKREALYDNLTTEDDHLMHIFGIEKSKSGKRFFIVKNSWGDIGPYHGNINVSEAYFAINTISLVIPKAALSKELLAKLRLN